MGAAAATWGVLGQLGLLLGALCQILPAAMDGLASGVLGTGQRLLAVATVLLLAYFQGYRGFQRGYAPRVVARAHYLARNPSPLHALLAPIYCMCLLHASRRRRIATCILVGTMIGLAILVGRLPPPYRAIVDLGVAFGLAWGAIAMAAFAAIAVDGRPPGMPLDLPPGTRRQTRGYRRTTARSLPRRTDEPSP